MQFYRVEIAKFGQIRGATRFRKNLENLAKLQRLELLLKISSKNRGKSENP
jgi:hypothetical protein